MFLLKIDKKNIRTLTKKKKKKQSFIDKCVKWGMGRDRVSLIWMQLLE